MSSARPHAWVEAAPFRAHLAHLTTVTGLPWPVIALAAGVPVTLAEHLLFGRSRRRMRRLPRPEAHRLLALTPQSVAALGRTWVPVEPTLARLGELTARGHRTDALAASLGLPEGQLLGLVEGRTPRVTAEFALRVRALLAASDRAVTTQAFRAA